MGEFYAMEYDAWDEGTVGLTLEEEAAFLRICHQIYRRQQPIPNSNKLLCALWRCHPNKAKALLQRLIIEGKITINEDGRLTNDRTAKEIHVRETLRTRRAHAGHTGGIRSGEARRKSLENNDPPEAKRSTGQDKTGHNKTEEQDAAPAAILPFEALPTKQKSPEEQAKTDYYAQFRQVLGSSGPAMATKLLKAKGGNIWQAMAAFGAARESGDIRSYLGGIVNRSHDTATGIHPGL